MAATTETATGFEVLQTGILLSDAQHDKWNPGKSLGKIYGDVARIGDRLVARWASPWSDGTPDYLCATYDPALDPVQRACGRSQDWAAVLRTRVEATETHVLQPDGADLEIARFRTLWPAVSAALGLPDAIGPCCRLFDAGEVRYPKVTAAGVLAAERWRGWVDEHTLGNYGLNGDDPGGELDQPTLFTLSEQPVAVQNRAAINAGYRAIRSQYLLPDEDQVTLPPYRRYVADVLTILRRGGNQTVCTLSTIGR